MPSVYCSLVLLCKCKCVRLTAGLLSSRHIHRSAAHSPSTHPEAVWVSEQEWALVVFPCITLRHQWATISLRNGASGKYMSVSVSICNSRSSLLAYLSFVGLRGLEDGSHICGNRRAYQRWMCDSLVVFGQWASWLVYLLDWPLSLRRLPRSGCVVETARLASRSRGLLSS